MIWEDLYQYVKFDLVLYVIKYDKSKVVSQNEANEDNTQFRNIYQSIQDLKYLLSDPLLNNCYFYVIINEITRNEKDKNQENANNGDINKFDDVLILFISSNLKKEKNNLRKSFNLIVFD